MGIELAIAAIVLSVASGIYTAVSQVNQAKQQKKVADYNAALARNNAVSAKAWADYNETREREKQKYRRGKMMVAFMKNGVTIDEGGSADAVLDEQLVQDELDSLSIRRQGQMAQNRYLSQADMSVFEGKEAIRAGYTAAAGTLITTGADVASIGLDAKASKKTTGDTGAKFT